MNRAPRTWLCRGRELRVDKQPLIMGILNVTPDSFSDGGRYVDESTAVEHGLAMIADGADIVDVGGESTRPGAAAVPEDEECRRVIPVVRALVAQTKTPISIDTTKAGVARKALDAGAAIVNDVSALTGDPDMAAAARDSRAGLVLMHMQGAPRTMQDNPIYANVVEDVAAYLAARLIADRMVASLRDTAQLTLNSSADARRLLAMRARLKTSAEVYGLRSVTINDMVLFAASRIVPLFPEINAVFDGTTMARHSAVHLAVAVDTPRGLMVPVIKEAQGLSLRLLAGQAARLAAACQKGNISPDELAGGTITVTNLGNLGVESFTPVLNAPQVAILGIGGITLRPVREAGEVVFVDSIGLSLTINHQVVDGAPAARFLKAMADGLAEIDLLCAW